MVKNILLGCGALLALHLWMSFALSAVFRKAGASGARAWLPVANAWAALRLGGRSGWWAVAYFLVLLALATAALVTWRADDTLAASASWWAALAGVATLASCGFAAVWGAAAHRIGSGLGAGAGMTALGIVLPPVWASVLGWGGSRWDGTSSRPDDAELAGWVARGPGSAGSPVPATPERPDGSRLLQSAAWAASQAPSGRPTAAAPPMPGTSMSAMPMPAMPMPAMPSTPGTTVPRTPGTPVPPPPPPVRGVAAPGPALVAPPPAGPAHRDLPPTETRARAVLPVLPPGEWGDGAAAVRATHPPLSPLPPAPSAPPPSSSRVPLSPPPLPPAPLSPPSPSPAASAPPSPIPLPPLPPLPPATTSAPAAALPAGAVPTVGVERPREAWGPPPAAAAHPFDEWSAAAGLEDAEDADPTLWREPQRDGGEVDKTVLKAHRRRWFLVATDGVRHSVDGVDVVVGRAPTRTERAPGAALVAVADPSRTVSKTHARLLFADDRWLVTDLGSTNGTAVVSADGVEREVGPGESAEVVGRFLLGDCELRLEEG